MGELNIDVMTVDPEGGISVNWHEHRVVGGEKLAGVTLIPKDDWPPEISAAVDVLSDALQKATLERIRAVAREAKVGES